MYPTCPCPLGSLGTQVVCSSEVKPIASVAQDTFADSVTANFDLYIAGKGMYYCIVSQVIPSDTLRSINRAV